jgi:hypothetical protein
MKIELDIVGLIQHLDLVTGEVRCIALIQSASGECTELPISEQFAEQIAARHAASPRSAKTASLLPRAATPPASSVLHSSEIEVVTQGVEAAAVAVLNAIEEDADYNPSDAEFEALAAANIDLVSLIQQGIVVPGSRAKSEPEPREFGLEDDAGAPPPAFGSLMDAVTDTPAEEATATQKTIAALRDKARRSPREPRTVPHDEAGNPVAEQRPQTKARKGGGSGDDLFGQG